MEKSRTGQIIEMYRGTGVSVGILMQQNSKYTHYIEVFRYDRFRNKVGKHTKVEIEPRWCHYRQMVKAVDSFGVNPLDLLNRIHKDEYPDFVFREIRLDDITCSLGLLLCKRILKCLKLSH
jgi:hypothetical protein